MGIRPKAAICQRVQNFSDAVHVGRNTVPSARQAFESKNGHRPILPGLEKLQRKRRIFLGEEFDYGHRDIVARASFERCFHQDIGGGLVIVFGKN